MKLKLDIHEKYEEKLEIAKEMDPTIETRLVAQLEASAMEHIVEVSSQAEQAQEEAIEMDHNAAVDSDG